MNTHRRSTNHSKMWIVDGRFPRYTHEYARRPPNLPVENKKRKKQLIARMRDNRIVECEMRNLECAYLVTIHVHDRSGKFDWILY